MRKVCTCVLFTAFILLIVPAAVYPSTVEFTEWLDGLRKEAIAAGISAATLDAALEGLQPIPRVIELDRNQPEFKKDYRTYMKQAVSEARIRKGREMLLKHRGLLENIRKQYGIQPRFLVAIWGLETNFGTYLGKFPIIDSVATLAHDARRSTFFRRELLHALKIVDEGHIDISQMEGSWAGAMGQVQFMPSTFISFAVDGDKDGRKDIWHNLSDVFASAANFLSSYGWRNDMIWGREVLLPPDFDQKLAGLETKKHLSKWQAMGVRRKNGGSLPDFDTEASLILPASGKSPSFLVYQNYRSIMRWNHSHYYALAVCRLADLLADR